MNVHELAEWLSQNMQAKVDKVGRKHNDLGGKRLGSRGIVLLARRDPTMGMRDRPLALKRPKSKLEAVEGPK